MVGYGDAAFAIMIAAFRPFPDLYAIENIGPVIGYDHPLPENDGFIIDHDFAVFAVITKFEFFHGFFGNTPTAIRLFDSKANEAAIHFFLYFFLPFKGWRLFCHTVPNYSVPLVSFGK